MPKAFIWPKVTKSAMKAPKTVRYPFRPARSSSFEPSCFQPTGKPTSESEIVWRIVVAEMEGAELGSESHFSRSNMSATRECSGNYRAVEEQGVVEAGGQLSYLSHWRGGCYKGDKYQSRYV